jgi:hypothetical protein
MFAEFGEGYRFLAGKRIVAAGKGDDRRRVQRQVSKSLDWGISPSTPISAS